jgi:hypothetical protein
MCIDELKSCTYRAELKTTSCEMWKILSNSQKVRQWTKQQWAQLQNEHSIFVEASRLLLYENGGKTVAAMTRFPMGVDQALMFLWFDSQSAWKNSGRSYSFCMYLAQELKVDLNCVQTNKQFKEIMSTTLRQELQVQSLQDLVFPCLRSGNCKNGRIFEHGKFWVWK